MRIAITGPESFIGWHARCAWRAATGTDVVHIGRAEFRSPEAMDRALVRVDAVIHLAGVNRARDEETIAEVNPELARRLIAGLQRTNQVIPVVYGNSIHALGDSVFGVAKRAVADLLNSWSEAEGGAVIDVLLPNVFGEHGRPHYNSVVATFCHQVVNGERPVIVEDRELPLLHAQRAARYLLDSTQSAEPRQVRPEGTRRTVSELLGVIQEIDVLYRTADLPDLTDAFTRDLFNTYRSFTFPSRWPVYPPVREDERGHLVEAVRSRGGQTQVFFSNTRPGFVRGQHYHLQKLERFLVLEGRGTIRMRKLFTPDVVDIQVSGDRPAIVDMPTMWVHSLVNTGTTDLVALFYADEVFDPAHPDTFAESVDL